MPPFIEIGGAVWIVEGWDFEDELPERLFLRRLTPEERTLYEHLRRAIDIELFTNFAAGG